MSELRETLTALDAHEERLDQYEARLDGHDHDLAHIRKVMELLDRAQKTAERQIDIFRDNMIEESRKMHVTITADFTRLRAELKGLLNGNG